MSAASPVDSIFVYGTLLRGECRHGALGGRRNVLAIEPAFVAGALVDCGAYPGFHFDPEPRCRVAGELVRVRDVSGTLAKLDRIEGYRAESVQSSLYRRELVEAYLESGEARAAWIYVLVRPERSPRIDSGSWRSRECVERRPS